MSGYRSLGMKFPAGLLVVTTPIIDLPVRIRGLLLASARYVADTLYIHLQPGFHKHKGECFPISNEIRNLIKHIYSTSNAHVRSMDVRFLLDNVTNSKSFPPHQNLSRGCEILLTDSIENEIAEDAIGLYVRTHFPPLKKISQFPRGICCEGRLDDGAPGVFTVGETPEPCKTYDNIVVGGTFDRLHNGHKILLSEACVLANKSLVVGVTDEEMHSHKILAEMVQPLSTRIERLREFISDIAPKLELKIEPITDPYGPSIVEKDLECIVVSPDTAKGGAAVVKKRKELGLSELDIVTIDLVEDEEESPEKAEETKMSSSSLRYRELGTLVKDPGLRENLPHKPYIIGVTGGIAAGKSSLVKRLESLGAGVVDCDKIGHEAYKKGSLILTKLVEVFGPEILTKEGEVNRTVLGDKVFGVPEEIQKLNDIMWPEIYRLTLEKVAEMKLQGKTVMVLDAALLLEAGWDKLVHEVWLTIVPRQEALKRLLQRPNMTEEKALKRIQSQMSNEERVERANVILSTTWEPEVTQKQVEKAWALLEKRVHFTRKY